MAVRMCVLARVHVCVVGGDRSSVGSSGSVTSVRSSGSGQSAGSAAHILHAQAEGVKVRHPHTLFSCYWLWGGLFLSQEQLILQHIFLKVGTPNSSKIFVELLMVEECYINQGLLLVFHPNAP